MSPAPGEVRNSCTQSGVSSGRGGEDRRRCPPRTGRTRWTLLAMAKSTLPASGRTVILSPLLCHLLVFLLNSVPILSHLLPTQFFGACSMCAASWGAGIREEGKRKAQRLDPPLATRPNSLGTFNNGLKKTPSTRQL